MAKKKVAAIVKIQIEAGKATPAPPVGTALGPHGIAIMDFVKAYNAATESQAGTVVSFDPDSGEEVERLSLGREVRTPPQVAAGRMFVMGHNGTLVAVE